MILIGNDDRNQRASQDLIADLKDRVKGSGRGDLKMFKPMPS